MATANTLTAAQLEQLAQGNSIQQVEARSYLLNHLNDEPPGVTGPGGFAGTLDNLFTTAGKLPGAVGGAASSVTNGVSYVINNAKYAGIWVGLMILAIALVLMGLSRNGLKPPMPPVVVAP
jgi:hypothetical protein